MVGGVVKEAGCCTVGVELAAEAARRTQHNWEPPAKKNEPLGAPHGLSRRLAIRACAPYTPTNAVVTVAVTVVGRTKKIRSTRVMAAAQSSWSKLDYSNMVSTRSQSGRKITSTSAARERPSNTSASHAARGGKKSTSNAGQQINKTHTNRHTTRKPATLTQHKPASTSTQPDSRQYRPSAPSLHSSCPCTHTPPAKLLSQSSTTPPDPAAADHAPLPVLNAPSEMLVHFLKFLVVGMVLVRLVGESCEWYQVCKVRVCTLSYTKHPRASMGVL